MIRIHLANILLICVLGTLLLWPEFEVGPPVDESVRKPYESVCLITSSSMSASGVLLESGYVLTAAHVVDRNYDGVIQPEEKTLTLNFPTIDFTTQATALYSGDVHGGMDVAILKVEKMVPLDGVKVMSAEEYWSLKIGTPVTTIGMQAGAPRANITDGRLITMRKNESSHRNSANSYYGNSGGGVFVNNKLVGIASALGLGRQRMMVPIFNVNPRQRTITRVGMVSVPYTVPLANSSVHVSAPAVRKFLTDKKLKENPFWELPSKCPYDAYFAVMGFNALLFISLMLIFKVMRRWWT